MSNDEIISEINRNTHPPRGERRMNMTKELSHLKTQIKYMFYVIILACVISLSGLMYTIDAIYSTCQRNEARFQEIQRVVSDLKQQVEFLEMSHK